MKQLGMYGDEINHFVGSNPIRMQKYVRNALPLILPTH
jgi:hypothetical protein